MATTLSFQIMNMLVNQRLNDKGGNWQYVGAQAVEQSSHEQVTLLAMKRDNSSGGNSFAASMLTATLLFSSQDNQVPDNLTIQGLHDLTSNNETGSVSSASKKYADYIGGTFTFDFLAKVLTVYPR